MSKNQVKVFFGMAVVGMLALASGCAHSPHARGSVALKESDEEAHVCLGQSEVKAGDRVALYKSECTGASAGVRRGGGGRTCTKVKLGEGVVIKTLNDHYSNIRVDSGVQFDEGAIVEKL